MTSGPATLLWLFTFLLAGPAWGEDDAEGPDVRPAEVCASILADGGLNQQRWVPDVDAVAAASRGQKALVVAIRGLGRPDSINPAEISPGVTYVVRPMRERAGASVGQHFALVAGSRRAILSECRRLQTKHRPDRFGFAVVMADPFARINPPTATPVRARDLKLTEVIFANQRRPNLALYDVESPDLYFVVGPDELGAFTDGELAAGGVASGEAEDLHAWWTHELRQGSTKHLIRVRHYGVLSQPAFRALEELATSEVTPPPSTRPQMLIEPLRACLDQACRSKVEIPKPAPIPARTSAALVGRAIPAELAYLPQLELPSPAEFRQRINAAHVRADRIGVLLVHLVFAPPVSTMTVLDVPDSLAWIFDLLWARYLPDSRPEHKMLKHDGRKIVSPGRDHAYAKVRSVRMFQDLKTQLQASP